MYHKNGPLHPGTKTMTVCLVWPYAGSWCTVHYFLLCKWMRLYSSKTQPRIKCNHWINLILENPIAFRYFMYQEKFTIHPSHLILKNSLWILNKYPFSSFKNYLKTRHSHKYICCWTNIAPQEIVSNIVVWKSDSVTHCRGDS